MLHLIKYIESLASETKNKLLNNQNSVDNSFNNEIVVISGFRNKFLQKFIEERGGKIVTTVFKKTTLLIVKDLGIISDKIDKAKNFSIKIISYDKFVNKHKFKYN